jgi:hypothetical protein
MSHEGGSQSIEGERAKSFIIKILLKKQKIVRKKFEKKTKSLVPPFLLTCSLLLMG